MKQLRLLRRPTRHELMETLKADFSQDYSYRFFGIGSRKSIIVRKSPFVAVQISYRREKILLIEGTYASIVTALIVQSVYSFFGNAAHSTPSTRKSWKKLEEELVKFIHHKFHPAN